MRYLLGAGNTLIVRGPASFRLLNGEATILGGPLGVDKSVVVRREKQSPIFTNSDTELDLTVARKSQLLEVNGSTIPSSWESAAEALGEMHSGKVMVIGGPDIGKSTLCTYLANTLFSKGVPTTIIDADIGQADIGPPTTIGRANLTESVTSLVDLEPEAILFIGHITPSQVETRLIDGIRHLLDFDNRSITVINTDGWVLDPEAVIYKIRIIDAVQPDVVLGISTGPELQAILSGSGARSMRLDPPKNVLTRSRTDRRELRTASYQRFLEGATHQKLLLQNVALRLPHGMRSTRASRESDLANLIIGQLDTRDFLIQIGVLLKLEHDWLEVYSRPAIGVRKIEVGYVRLSTGGLEFGYLDR
jgi:polynucleotide 5'-hydroxyl-kinase GRC3/NOL9